MEGSNHLLFLLFLNKWNFQGSFDLCILNFRSWELTVFWTWSKLLENSRSNHLLSELCWWKVIATVSDCSPAPILQGLTMELLCGFAPSGSHMDVSCTCHHWPALCTIPDSICCLWFYGGLCHCNGALHPAKRGILTSSWQQQCQFSPSYFIFSQNNCDCIALLMVQVHCILLLCC